MTARRAQIEIRRTHPNSDPCWRSWCCRNLSLVTEQTAGFDMDNRLQIAYHCTLHDSGRGTGCYAEVLGCLTESEACNKQLYRWYV